jgi:hypothetical protein
MVPGPRRCSVAVLCRGRSLPKRTNGDDGTKDVSRNYLALTAVKRRSRTMKLSHQGTERERTKAMLTRSANYDPDPRTTLATPTNVAPSGSGGSRTQQALAHPLMTSRTAVLSSSTSSGERPGSPKDVGAAVYQLQYAVPWQLLPVDYEYGNGDDGLGEVPPAPDPGPQSVACSAGLLAGADLTAVVACGDDDMTVETTSTPMPGLLPGAVLSLADHLGPAAKAAVRSLLAGRCAWVDCLPPSGFRSAALIAVPSLAPCKRMVLVASIRGRFEKRDLGSAAAYLVQARQVSRQPLDLQEVAA